MADLPARVLAALARLAEMSAIADTRIRHAGAESGNGRRRAVLLRPVTGDYDLAAAFQLAERYGLTVVAVTADLADAISAVAVGTAAEVAVVDVEHLPHWLHVLGAGEGRTAFTRRPAAVPRQQRKKLLTETEGGQGKRTDRSPSTSLKFSEVTERERKVSTRAGEDPVHLS